MPVTPEPNLNPTPKNRFRESGQNISEHRAMVESRQFQRACDFAALEYSSALAAMVSENPQNAAYAGLKLCGFMEGLYMLRAMSEAPRVVVRTPPANLDHKA